MARPETRINRIRPVRDFEGPARATPTRNEIPGRLTVALVDPRPLTRASVAQLLADRGAASRRADDFAVLSFAKPAELIADCPDRQASIGLVLINIGSEAVSNPRLHRDLEDCIAAMPHAPLAILSDSAEPGCMVEAIRLGARGYIPTSLDLPVVKSALHLIASGGTYVPFELLGDHFLQHLEPHGCSTREQPGELTPRQRDVLRLIKLGHPNKVIAHELGVRESTIKVYVRQIMQRLHADNRTHAVFLAASELEKDD